MKYLFEEIIQIQTIRLKFNEMNLSNEEKEELLEIVKSTVHHKVIDLILNELTDEEKEIFLEGVSTDKVFSDANKHKQYIDALKERIINLEEKIIQKVKEAEEELLNLLTDQTSREV